MNFGTFAVLLNGALGNHSIVREGCGQDFLIIQYTDDTAILNSFAKSTGLRVNYLNTKYGSFGHFSVKLGPFTSRTWDYQWLAGSGTMKWHIYARMFYNKYYPALELKRSAKEMRDKNEYKTDFDYSWNVSL
ncbi:hypothetical protein ACJX0J_034411, partial [Zea mays]